MNLKLNLTYFYLLIGTIRTNSVDVTDKFKLLKWSLKMKRFNPLWRDVAIR